MTRGKYATDLMNDGLMYERYLMWENQNAGVHLDGWAKEMMPLVGKILNTKKFKQTLDEDNSLLVSFDHCHPNLGGNNYIYWFNIKSEKRKTIFSFVFFEKGKLKNGLYLNKTELYKGNEDDIVNYFNNRLVLEENLTESSAENPMIKIFNFLKEFDENGEFKIDEDDTSFEKKAKIKALELLVVTEEIKRSQ